MFNVFEWFVLVLQCDAVVVIVLSDSQGRTKGEGWSTANKFKPPSHFIAGRPKAVLLFWFFVGFRCCVWLFFIILVRYKNRK